MVKANEIVIKFQRFLDQMRWFEEGEKVLLAVSGGLDSVAMADLFRHTNISFGIAHCNFQLRGSASNEDAEFVKNLAGLWNIPYYQVDFPTNELVRQRKISLQVLARELRYEWLEEMRLSHGYDWIATAHHINDSIETVLYNWAKGTGIRGLLGIPMQNGRVIRPLMFTDRLQLEEYIHVRELAYRIDASNLDDKYNRNKIRHHIWPVLKKINPSLESTFRTNLEHLREVELLYGWALNALRLEWTMKSEEEFRIAISPLRTFPAAQTLLFEWLKEYHFSSRQIKLIFNSLYNQPGAVFFSASHRLLIDREWLIVVPLPFITDDEADLIIFQTDRLVELPEGKLFIDQDLDCPLVFPNSPWEIFLDADKLKFPLYLRHWRAGDVFFPLGMHGKRQKIQDFFSNQKLSVFEKEKAWLLTQADGEIAWVLGYRISENLKISETTARCCRLRFQKM